MEKRAESTGNVVDITSPAGPRERLLSKNIKQVVSFSHTICLESSWPALVLELV